MKDVCSFWKPRIDFGARTMQVIGVDQYRHGPGSPKSTHVITYRSIDSVEVELDGCVRIQAGDKVIGVSLYDYPVKSGSDEEYSRALAQADERALSAHRELAATIRDHMEHCP